MEVSNYLKKFKLLLENVFEGKIVLKENNVEKLLKFLEDRKENSPGKRILDTPAFSDLIYHSLGNINGASNLVKVFLIEIVTILFKDELQFTRMQMHGFQALTLKFCTLGNMNDLPLSLHLACIKLATAQITHCSGLQILREHKAWKKILYANIHLKPQPISKAAYNFMAKLVSKLNEYDLESDLLEVLGYITEPIRSSGYLNSPEIDTQTDTAFSEVLLPHLGALLAVMREADNLAPVNKVMHLIKYHFVIDLRLYEMFTYTKNGSLLRLMNTSLYQLNFGALRHLLYSKNETEFCISMIAFHRNYLVHAVQKREALILIDFVIQSTIIWSNIEKTFAAELNFPLTFEWNGKKIEYSVQIIVHLLVPVVKHYLMYLFSKNVEAFDVIEQFMMKMGKSLTDHIYSCCYTFANLLEDGDANFRMKVTTNALQEMLRLSGHLNESQAGILFQGLYYLLEMFISSDGTELVLNENNIGQDDLRLLSHLLNAMKMLLKEHRISWYETVEIVSIQADLLNLLKQTFLTAKHVVQVLDLIDICVKKFLSPNMSLLVETKSTQSSTLNEIGEVIKLYIQHEDWEVRDSAFNLLYNCTEIAFIKYIPLQKVITENNLMLLAAKAGLTDPDFYSQCTALKCLAAATKIDSIWQEVLIANENTYFQLVYILRNHSEGMVRTEAANVLTAIYINQKLIQSFQNMLYEVMMTAALDDLHWEVQLAALTFWKQAIHKQLTYRGMLDGKFPSVTFSKEKRKIITLDEREIKRQLTGIMIDLSNTGCLTVLLGCMNELHNIEVMEQGCNVAKELIEVLDKYKFETVTETVLPQPVLIPPKYLEKDRNIDMDLCNVTSEEDRNKIIDEILSTDQSELIINLHNNYCQTKMEEMDVDVGYTLQKQYVHPNKFLEAFRNNNYSSIIEAKKNCNSDCISTLDGVLNEILDI